MSSPDRRTFVRTAAGAAALGLTDLPFLGTLPAVRADEARLDPKLVRLDSGIEPLVRVLEETPRDKLIEEMAARVKKARRDGERVIDAGRLLIFLKGTDSHDYKFSSATMEDYDHVSPEFRDRFLAASLYWLKGSGAADAPIVKRIHKALA